MREQLTFGSGDISTIDVDLCLVPFRLLLLIVLPLDLGKRTVTSLVDVLVEVLYRSNGGGDFNVDVRIILERKVWVVRNDRSVVEHGVTLLEGTAVVTSSVDRVALIVHDGRCGEASRIAFGTPAIFHARSIGVVGAASPFARNRARD
jgi:hypothetical protein